MPTIAIVNDTAIAVEALHRAIAAMPNYQLLWVANTGRAAVECCAAQTPDLILMDLNMPELDGVEATRQIMQRSPCAILIVTASITRNTAKVFEAMGHGALDVVTAPALGSGDPQAVQTLLKKMAIAIKLVRSAAPSTSPFTSPSTGPFTGLLTSQFTCALPAHKRSPQRLGQHLGQRPSQGSGQSNKRSSKFTNSSLALPPLMVMGTSTGGPHALQHILSRLPSRSNVAIVVIQHIDVQFAASLVNWLNQTSRLPVALAKNGDRPTAGKVLVAGTNDHLILRPNQTLRYIHEPAHLPYRPSVDVFFQSVAHHWPQPGIALLLTGMGRDGANGMAQLHTARWHTIAESAKSCVIFGMPKAAIALGAVKHILPLDQIAPHVVNTLALPAFRF